MGHAAAAAVAALLREVCVASARGAVLHASETLFIAHDASFWFDFEKINLLLSRAAASVRTFLTRCPARERVV